MKACVFIAFRNCGLSSPEFNSVLRGRQKHPWLCLRHGSAPDYGCDSDKQAQAWGPAEGGLGFGAASICQQHRASGFRQPIPDFPCLVHGHANTDLLCFL